MTGIEIMQSYGIEPWADGSFAVVDAGGCPWHFAVTRWAGVMWLAEFAERMSDRPSPAAEAKLPPAKATPRSQQLVLF